MLFRVVIPINANGELISAGRLLDDSKAEAYGIGDDRNPKAPLDFAALQCFPASIVPDTDAEVAVKAAAATPAEAAGEPDEIAPSAETKKKK